MATALALYDVMLERVLLVARILRARSLLADSPDTDYAATRDNTLHCLDGHGERFSYKDHHRTEQHVTLEGLSGRFVWARYRPWIAGQVVKVEWKFVNHPLYDSERLPCAVLHLKCINEDHPTWREIFCDQVKTLKQIVDTEDTTAPSKTTTSWVHSDNDTDTIMVQITDCYEYVTAQIEIGQNLMICVSMTRDEYTATSGDLSKTFTLWADTMCHIRSS
ncbi:hypothetical protein B0H13DRAFT_2380999 [Mycena leptocephala]|nr:hypothetical protein B0H13DRAFT_2380999 [Mycena leptocephala]